MVIQLVKPLPGATTDDSRRLSPATLRAYSPIPNALWLSDVFVAPALLPVAF
jgi:hypothetical protein